MAIAKNYDHCTGMLATGSDNGMLEDRVGNSTIRSAVLPLPIGRRYVVVLAAVITGVCRLNTSPRFS